jgi:polysaccharide pyruvyl transferase WcaK-like protein
MMRTHSLADPAPRFPDAYWKAACEAALRALDEAEHVLVPTEFLSLNPRFAPLEYSWGLKDFGRLAWCCTKDDVHRLAPWLHAAAADRASCAWSNEVFVVGGNFHWSRPADAPSRRHLVAWFERVRQYRKGVPAYRSTERWPLARSVPEEAKDRRRVLIVGASGMGNVGDDLLAEVLAEMVAEEGAEARLSGPDIDPLRVRNYDAVVVGGGGLIYASRDGSNETQNLANYLKFGPMGRHFGIPVGLIGVGDQDHAGWIERDSLTRTFARNAVAQFQQITTRDAASTALLQRLEGADVRTGCDLLFGWAGRARSAVRPTTTPTPRFALVGELFRHVAFTEGLGDRKGSLGALVRDRELDVLVMSDDDVPHARRMCKALQEAGASAESVDLREQDFESLLFLFASYRGVITTRFHGLLFAALAGVPVLALDESEGKKARLLRDIGATGCLAVEGSPEATVARLERALQGGIERVPPEKLQEVSAQAETHRLAARTLINMSMKGGSTASLLVRSLWRNAVTRKSTDDDEPLTASSLCEAGSVGLCWAHSTPHTEGRANLGDSLSAVMVGALSGRPVHNVPFQWPVAKLVAVGSIGHAIRDGLAVVWGSGVSIRGGVLARNARRTRYDVRAIRGPISAQHYRDFGISVPEVYGDPVWLLPSVFCEPVEKKYELGVIPHIQDVEGHLPDAPPKRDSLRYVVDGAGPDEIAVINTWHDPTMEGLLAKLRLIRSCKRIASQSFHGVVIAEAYGIPVLNFRYLVGERKNGALRIDLAQECTTDPRVWEFYRNGPRPWFAMYCQHREDRTDWEDVIRSIDTMWEPFEFDAAPLVESFPLPLAFNPLRERPRSLRHLDALRF